MADKEKSKHLLAALALGGALGAVAGLLLAPRRGRELRAQLRDGSSTLVELARERLASPEQESTPSAAPHDADYDVIVVGAGHNGLVTAAYLAKAGLRVVVLERREQVGGAATTEELFPGYRVSPVADGAGYLSSQVVEDLQLRAKGLTILPTTPLVFSPLPDGNSLTIWENEARTMDEIGRFSARDAARWPTFVQRMQSLAGVVHGLMEMTPPDLPDVGLQNLPQMKEMVGPLRRLGRENVGELLRTLPMPIADLLDEWFESEALKGAIAANGVRGITWGPMEAGTAYLLLYRWAGSSTGLFRSGGVVEGGMGALSESIARAARSFGAEIRTGSPVSELVCESGRVSRVRLENGKELTAKAIVSNADPRTTFLDLMDPYYLNRTVVRHVENIKYRGSSARVHFALNKLPAFTALAGKDPAAYLAGHIQIAPSVRYLQRAYDHVKYGENSRRPYLDMMIPTLTDPSLAPQGKHILSTTVQYMPYHLRHADWNELHEALARLVTDTISEYAPDFGDCVEQVKVLTSVDLEQLYRLPEGNPSHGEMTLDQFLHMRPLPGYAQYRSPAPGLYLCGASAHPGGGVTGIPGRNAARELLNDWRSNHA